MSALQRIRETASRHCRETHGLTCRVAYDGLSDKYAITLNLRDGSDYTIFVASWDKPAQIEQRISDAVLFAGKQWTPKEMAACKEAEPIPINAIFGIEVLSRSNPKAYRRFPD